MFKNYIRTAWRSILYNKTIMDKWLQNFVYRINISWWVFLLAGILAILISLFTIGFQSVKAAMANPVKSLRRE